MLVGAQLGITLCSLGMGVFSEPMIAGTLTPLFHAVGLPEAAAPRSPSSSRWGW
ncbi:hypothetical protein ACQEVF_07105 [Nonomuraea polychroma]|uniref:hypothetical protein n=1 Tax=Nonomuraea polychroma TaxID=46176 RepID=UPI003D930BC4